MYKRIIALITLVILLPFQSFAIERVHGPYLQDAQPTQIMVIWETSTPTQGRVTYGTDSTRLDNVIRDNELVTLHKITLKNLQPRQTYYYQCVWDDGKSTIGKFRTAPADESTPLRFAVVGDSRSDLAMCTKISNLIVDYDPDIVLHSGDIVARGKNLDEWQTFLFDPARKLLQNIPFYPVLGNHEQESPYYYNFFPLHKNKPWWSVDYGPVHIIGLDTSVPTDPNSEQYKFLVDDLQKNKKEWTIVVFHYPIFHCHPTRPVYDFRYTWQPLFMKYGVDLVLNGHDHYYHRSFPIGRMAERQNGVIHITTAGGGASLYPTIPTPFSAYYRSLYHFLMIEVTEEELEVRAINDNNQVFDGIIINKNQDYSPANFVEYGMFELERDLNAKLGQLFPKTDDKGTVVFDTTFTVSTDFSMPVIGEYKWQAPDAWQINKSTQKFEIDPGENLQIELKGYVNKAHMLPTPILNLHIEADNSERNVTRQKPFQHYLGFRNQDLPFSLEEAAYRNAILSPPDNLAPIFNFLDYYPTSDHAYDVIVYLGWQILKTQDKRIFANLENLLKNNPTDLNKYRIYPFYFLFDDFSHLEEWIAVMGRLPSDQLSFAPKLICQLAELDIFNAQFVKNWKIIGPFEAPGGNGLKTVYPPETELDFTKTYPTGSGTQSGWKDYEISGNTIDFIETLNAPAFELKHGVVYAHTLVKAKEAGEILLLLGSNDDPVVWINNKEVHRKEIGRGVQACEDIILVPVRQGNNDILIKVNQQGGAWGLNLQISDWKGILE
jgi:predicted phosphodiesterase